MSDEENDKPRMIRYEKGVEEEIPWFLHSFVNPPTDPLTLQLLACRLKDSPLAVSRETGALLYMLARSSGARTIVEFGTSFGMSTLHLAAALQDNGGGRLITSEFEPSKVEQAKKNMAASGLIDLVEFREGDALRTLSVDLPETIDMVLLDGAKALYSEIMNLVESRLRPGAFMVAEDVELTMRIS